MAIKKLIEVALPLDKINAESAREKSIRHGHPSTLHLYWARRPLAAARAVIWSSLIDDPSSHPELFPTEEDQNKERQRLFKILEDLVVWENSNNPQVLDAAKAEIMRWTNNNPPEFLDPFAGGGAIPLEAQRLGLVSHAHDLNPVSVMINKAMIEIPPKFTGIRPINPESRLATDYNRQWNGLMGLAEDVRYYGEWLKKTVFEKIGNLYPKVKVNGRTDATVIAWLWARTVKCPNPVCNCEMPLVGSFVLSKKKNHEAWIEPVYKDGKFTFAMHRGSYSDEYECGTKYRNEKGKAKKGTFCCPLCKSGIASSTYVDEVANKGEMGVIPLAVIAEGEKERIYLPVDEKSFADVQQQVDAFYIENSVESKVPHEKTRGTFASNAQGGYYGFKEFKDYFTKRQLVMLTTFSEVCSSLESKIKEDVLGDEKENDNLFLTDYIDAIRIYLTFCIDKMTDYHSSVCSWNASGQKMRNTFGRQAIPMVWDFAECNPFCSSSGSYDNMLNWVVKSILSLPSSKNNLSSAIQFDAQQDCGLRNIMVSTDPPYYDNICYSDLSDFFYVWMRSNLKDIYPNLFKTVLTPKASELIATPYRFEGNMDRAKDFFESGMFETCKQIYKYASDDVPVSIYYAYKQGESETIDNQSKIASSGWETMLSAIVNAKFAITGTWPMRTEMAVRQVATESNALSSSIVLVCRKRPEDAPTTTRRNFIQELKRELKSSLQKLQSSNIAPVDMAQSAIGPGMGVFSKYTQVLEADGTPMSVRSALQIINQELDLYFNEQDGELDSNSRFCVDFYTQYGFNDAKFGDADTLARAKNTSVATLQSKGVFVAEKGVAHLVDRDKLPEKVDYADNMVWLFTQRLTRAMSTGGIKACATLIHNVHTSLPEQAKALAYRLHSIAERKGWQEEAFAYNSLVIAWTDIQMAAANIHESEDDQYKLDI